MWFPLSGFLPNPKCRSGKNKLFPAVYEALLQPQPLRPPPTTTAQAGKPSDDAMFVILFLLLLFIFCFGARLKVETIVTRNGPHRKGIIRNSHAAILEQGTMRVELSERFYPTASSRELMI